MARHVDELAEVGKNQKELLARRAKELQTARLEALAASRAKSEFLASMSHEIRTPMTAVLGFAELLVDDQGQPAPAIVQADAIRTIRRQGSHLLSVINGVLDLAKIESGQMEVESTPFSPAQLVEEVHALFGARAASMGLELGVERCFPLPSEVLSDPLRIRQVLVNLVGNALKFTPPPPQSPGRVVLRVSAIKAKDGGSSLVFECSDTGCGISDELAKKLFKPFAQADASTARRFGGSGLGLSISQRFAQLLGGSITVRRHERAPGVTFALTLPVCASAKTVWLQSADALAPNQAPEPAAMEGFKTLNGRILLVEDAIDNQRLIAHQLRKAGAIVALAENGRAALQMARPTGGESPFDLVLMDMQMPELDGYGATAELRAAGFDRPIIALTANAMDGDRKRCLDAGCDDYLSKPVDRRILLDTCAKWMKRTSADAAGPQDAARSRAA